MEDCNIELQNQNIYSGSLPDVNRKLWNPSSFAALSVFFSFLPAAILYSLNFGRLGMVKKRNYLIISSITLFCLGLVLSSAISQAIGKILFFGLNIGLGIYMQNDQKSLFKQHMEGGGKKASYAVPLISCFIAAGLIITCIIYSANIPDNVKSFQGDELYYTNNVNISDVGRLGDFFVNEGLFAQDGKTISLKIDKKLDIYSVSIVIDKKYINDNDTITYLQTLRKSISNSVFNDSKVEINICDEKFNLLKTINN